MAEPLSEHGGRKSIEPGSAGSNWDRWSATKARGREACSCSSAVELSGILCSSDASRSSVHAALGVVPGGTAVVVIGAIAVGAVAAMGR